MEEDLEEAPRDPSDLHILTLNCWGLLHISALRNERIAYIAHSLATMTPRPPDIVGLQELFTQEDYAVLRRRVRDVLPHGKFYHSGAFGGGLAILSRWPIVESSMHGYPLNGRPTAFWHGDWYVGKGVAHAKIRISDAGGCGGDGGDDDEDAVMVDVFNTHTHASYGARDDGYACHSAAQAWHMAKLLREADRGPAGGDRNLIVALGDFNMLPLSLAHDIITSHAPVHDVWRLLHPDSSLGSSGHPREAARGRPVPTVDFNLRENGATSNNVSNTWRWSKADRRNLSARNPCPVDPDAPDPHGQRLDYIFASTGHSPSPFSQSPSRPAWVVKDASVAMTHRHPDLQVSLSDHYAVHAILHRHSPGSENSSNRNSNADPSHALRSGTYLSLSETATAPPVVDVDFNAQLRHRPARDPARTLPLYDEIITLIDRCRTRELREQSWRGLHFYASVVIFIGCLVAVWFSPHNGVAFALLLVSTLGLVSGVINGLLALLFFSSELRNLAEFEWEIRNAKAAASGSLATLGEFDDEEAKSR
ncbi:sphingomyelin phosphodiesterase 2 [Geosmithia morbida]|uniref:Sphingomyelin phosphodiesterase 2 n=1 Tax=Geosmithia morbida TaxID=1094350 RepID=A0A9P4YVD2_9HYPO|nr:sphingomyelin phosphodiesterase 2 [Geosmithia morbida]KAF4122411.1 sphingomyelin phosphodiesterase 2 [Geosmithia morbida]